MIDLRRGDALKVLRTLDDGSARCCVTSPPYYGLRDYGCAGQIGLEKTPELYVARLVDVFREVRRILADDGTVWLNLGDSYNAYNGNRGDSPSISGSNGHKHPLHERGLTTPGLKPKDLIGIPWRVAFALQADGWYLRSEIIWHKPNGMTESVKDRPSKGHETLFLLSKKRRYYYDRKAASAPAKSATRARYARGRSCDHKNADGGPGRQTIARTLEHMTESGDRVNLRSVWTIATKGIKEAHFATFPPALPERCIRAGSAIGDTILDPFAGAGTVAMVAEQLGRSSIGIDLSAPYLKIARRRINAAIASRETELAACPA